MPFAKDLPEVGNRISDTVGRASLSPAVSTPNLAGERRDSLSLLATDMPQSEVEKDRRARRGEPEPQPPPPSPPIEVAAGSRRSIQGVAAAARAAMVWKRRVSQTTEPEVGSGNVWDFNEPWGENSTPNVLSKCLALLDVEKSIASSERLRGLTW